ncbi:MULTISPECIES: hypothetical protein [Arthrobacter]|uniref:Head-to-tail stopper n=1 Tax=Arthrobacter terricola TaxID=2547396 RepID=A0A4R5KA32_9MICC|nr:MULTISPECIES: hypothetical protein [Arthrobacter]MBT8162798.1 hypothetical protein [Arthrobacter sp. GN70]TDF92043.1 hypothetical protein E1809_18865 [Arthrobacter terricola]
MGIVGMFPKAWRTDVVVLRGGGRDAKGNPLPTSEIPVTDCLVGPRATAEPLDRSDVVDSTAALYRDNGFTFLSTDRVRVPEGTRMAGEWSIDGLPGEWPYGVEVGLRRA